MKNTHRRHIVITLILLLGLTLLTSCQRQNPPQETLPASTISAQSVTPNVVDNQYPSTPEEVIRAFLISYPSNQIFAIQYLSPTYVSKLDETSAAELLPASGEISGFIIEKGSTSAELEQSVILANIAFEKSSSQVEFKLEIVDGRWVINQIDAK